jgi:hypothetical protein
MTTVYSQNNESHGINEETFKAGLVSHEQKVWHDYNVYLNAVRLGTRQPMEEHRVLYILNTPIFDYDKFIECVGPELKQVFNCNSCREFLNKMGSVFYIDDSNIIRSFLFAQVETEGNLFNEYIADYLRRLSKTVLISDDNKLAYKVFTPMDKVIGNRDVKATSDINFAQNPDRLIYASRDIMRHFYVILEDNYVRTNSVHDSSAVVTSIHQLRVLGVRKLLAKHSRDILTTACELLTTKTVPGYNIFGKDLEWLLEISSIISNTPKSLRDACIIRLADRATLLMVNLANSSLGRYLELVNADTDYETLINTVTDMLSDLKYMSGDAAPKEQCIERADKFFTENGYDQSLYRRHAFEHEVPFFWKPVTDDDTQTRGGIFANIRSRQEKQKQQEGKVKGKLPATKMTWVKFKKDILPSAANIDFLCRSLRYPFAGFTMQQMDNAKPILIWDTDQCRNPLSMYSYEIGLSPMEMGIKVGETYTVKGISKLPHLLNPDMVDVMTQRFGDGDFLVIDRIVDQHSKVSISLFPFILKSIFHEYRKVIDAYNQNNFLGDDNRGCQGLTITAGLDSPIELIVTTTSGITRSYSIDRFE